MNPVYGKAAAIDVHKKMLAVVIASGEAGEGEELREKFGTTVSELRRLKE